MTDIAVEYAEKGEDSRRELREGMLMALSIRGSFFDAMESRANLMIPAT